MRCSLEFHASSITPSNRNGVVPGFVEAIVLLSIALTFVSQSPLEAFGLLDFQSFRPRRISQGYQFLADCTDVYDHT